jgi:threonine dehydrogenase-like Zn-dependent dehydrogenase
VFAFQPHQDYFCATPAELFPLPGDFEDQTALLLPSMETAVSLVQDGHPLLGEKVAVLGQGIVGLLTTGLLAQFPLRSLLTLDCNAHRRATSLAMGATDSRNPDEPGLLDELGATAAEGGKADLVYELSGNPAALDTAIALARFSGRVVIGSWYGEKCATVALGSWFHRGRLQLISSQVSNIGPELAGRWNPARRLDLVWRMLRQIRPANCITHRFPLENAAAAYALIDGSPGEAIQVLLDHGEDGQ